MNTPNLLEIADDFIKHEYNKLHEFALNTYITHVFYILNHPDNIHLGGFVNAMGSAFFITKPEFEKDSDNYISGEETVLVLGYDENDEPIKHDYAELITPLYEFLDEWNDTFGLTGTPFRFDQDNVTKEYIKSTDW